MIENKLIQISNAGVALCLPGEVFAIDCLHSGAGMYAGTTKEAYEWLVSRNETLYLLITHTHSDHVDPTILRRFVQERDLAGRRTEMFGFDEETRQLLARADSDATNRGLHTANRGLHAANRDSMERDLVSRLHILTSYQPRALSDQLTVTGYPTPHLDPQHYTLAHHSLFFEMQIARETVTVFVTADADLDRERYQSMAQRIRGCDVLVAPYAYGFTKRNDAFVKEFVAPHTFVVNHFPPIDGESARIYETFLRFREKYYLGDPLISFASFGDAYNLTTWEEEKL